MFGFSKSVSSVDNLLNSSWGKKSTSGDWRNLPAETSIELYIGLTPLMKFPIPKNVSTGIAVNWGGNPFGDGSLSGKFGSASNLIELMVREAFDVSLMSPSLTGKLWKNSTMNSIPLKLDLPPDLYTSDDIQKLKNTLTVFTTPKIAEGTTSSMLALADIPGPKPTDALMNTLFKKKADNENKEAREQADSIKAEMHNYAYKAQGRVVNLRIGKIAVRRNDSGQYLPNIPNLLISNWNIDRNLHILDKDGNPLHNTLNITFEHSQSLAYRGNKEGRGTPIRLL